MVQWYPGHIAAAEKALRSRLAAVDLVIEVRDGRCPAASAHPQLKCWARGREMLLLLNRADAVPAAERRRWSAALAATGTPAAWTDGRQGSGLGSVVAAAARLRAAMDGRRAARGLRPRSVRAAVVGFPNVGKSALINRLLDRRAVDSAPRPGVTRQLAWARAGPGGALDLLDSPGVIPAAMADQAAAARLAMCGDIGEAAYVASRVAAALLDLLPTLPRGEELRAAVQARYALRLGAASGEEYVQRLAELRFNRESERAGERVLRDYRDLKFGAFCLELPPEPFGRGHRA